MIDRLLPGGVRSYVFASGDYDPGPALGLLSAEEHDRYDQFRDRARARDYAAAHLLKRKVLAHYLAEAPAELVFYRDAAGKPYLRGEALQFNLSHSHGWVALAVSANLACGVDIESHNAVGISPALMRACMSESEQAVIRASRTPAVEFHDRWVVKEALLKARGTGLTSALRDLCTVQGNWLDGTRGELIALHRHPEFSMALCARGPVGNSFRVFRVHLLETLIFAASGVSTDSGDSFS